MITKNKLRAITGELHGALTEGTAQLALYAQPTDAASVDMVAAHRALLDRTRADVAADESAEKFSESRTHRATAANAARNFHE